MVQRSSQHNRRVRRVRRRANGRGQSMVEFAMAIPIFLALLFGTLEMGMLFKTQAAYDEAAQQAARISAAEGNAIDSDTHVLTQLRTFLAAENLNQITSVTIYDATITGAPVNTTAQSVYTYSGGHFYCQGATSPPPDTTCPASLPAPYTVWSPLLRDTQVGALDHIGVRINYNYRGVTGMLPLMHLSDNATTIIEPNSYGP